MNIVVFEDDAVSRLYPITLSRPAYAISCASFRLFDWLESFEGNLVGLVRPYLNRIQACDFPRLQQQLDPNLKWTLVVNARLVPAAANLRRLESLMTAPLNQLMTSAIVRSADGLAAAVIPTSRLLDVPRDTWRQQLPELASDCDRQVTDVPLDLFDYPHTVIASNLDTMQENLRHRIDSGNYFESRPGLFVGDGVQLSPQVVVDTAPGPIVIEDHVKIGPFTFLRGPVYIGPRCRVSEHASIKDSACIQHTCKIGGEIEGTVLEPYTNKQHHGFLGHSYLGSWINLGAGTCNSDLKNTYGTVNMEYGSEKVSTGLQFVGCIMGDYAKTAINTSIFTGKTIGVASMVYGFATTNVPSFVNYARTFNEYGTLPPEVIVTTQKRMFARRNVEQRPCDIQLLHDIYRLTEEERPDGLSSKPLAL